jgi:hypothetical protein
VRVHLRDLHDMRDPAQKPPGVCCGTPHVKPQPRITE